MNKMKIVNHEEENELKAMIVILILKIGKQTMRK